MKTNNEYLTDSHQADLQWRKDLDFYKEEIAIFKKRLEEISAKNSSKEIKMLVSHFENQFAINNNVIDELNHDINIKEQEISAEIKNNPIAFEHRVTNKYAELKGKMSVFVKLYAELKNEFNKFSASVL